MTVRIDPRRKIALRGGIIQAEIQKVLQDAYDAVALRYLEAVERLEAEFKQTIKDLLQDVKEGILRPDQLEGQIKAVKEDNVYLKNAIDKRHLTLKTEYYLKGLKELLGPRSNLQQSLKRDFRNFGIELDVLTYHFELKSEKVFVDLRLSGSGESFDKKLDVWVKNNLGISKLNVIDVERGRVKTFNQITQTRV